MDQALGGIMYSPTPVVAAQAFDLGRPVSELLPVRRGDTDTWRIDTVKGSYLIKGYWPTTGGQFTDGQLPDQLEVAMAFERRALEAGADMAAQIHQLQPLSQVGLPDWWRAAIWPRVTWEEWFAEAQRRNKSWSDLAHERLPHILEISARIEAVCEVAPDSVMTHGDFKTHNMLKTPTGQVLVDWDSVRVDSAALEAGRVAFIFGAGKLAPIRRILGAYAAAGGDITWPGRDLFLSVARHELQGLFERILVSLEQIPAPRWMEDSRAIGQSIGELLRELPNKIDALASKTSDLGAGNSDAGHLVLVAEILHNLAAGGSAALVAVTLATASPTGASARLWKLLDAQAPAAEHTAVVCAPPGREAEAVGLAGRFAGWLAHGGMTVLLAVDETVAERTGTGLFDGAVGLCDGGPGAVTGLRGRRPALGGTHRRPRSPRPAGPRSTDPRLPDPAPAGDGSGYRDAGRDRPTPGSDHGFGATARMRTIARWSCCVPTGCTRRTCLTSTPALPHACSK